MFFYSIITSEGTVSEKLIVALAFVLVAVFSIVLHEVSHGLVAKWNGDLTAKDRGRLTFNPVVHFDMWGLLMMLLVGFGWARPVPINPNNFTKYKVGMFTVSIAGITANLIVACFCLLLYYLLVPVFYVSGASSVFGEVMLHLLHYVLILGIKLNFMLALFNLLPIFPLDGYNIVNTFLPSGNGYQRFMVRYGTFCLLGLILLGYIGDWTGVKWLDIFGSFSDLISKLITKVTYSRLIGLVG